MQRFYTFSLTKLLLFLCSLKENVELTHRVSWIYDQEVHGREDISRIQEGREATKGQLSDLALIQKYTSNFIEKCFKDACEYHRLVTHASFDNPFMKPPDWDGLLDLIRRMNFNLWSVLFNNLKGIDYLDGPELSTSSYEKMYSILAKNKLEVPRFQPSKSLESTKVDLG